MKGISLIQNQDKLKAIEEFIVKYKFLLFFLVFGVQLSLSSYKIADNSLWYDECFTVNTANKTVSGIVEVSKTDVNPPLYPMIVHFWMKLFGISEFSVRILSAIAASLASAFLFLFCLRFLNWQTAIFSVLMFLTTNDIFYYSQEARTYAFVLLFVVLSNYSFFRLIKEDRKSKSILIAIQLGLVNVGLFYLHFLSCFALIAQALMFPFFIFKKPQDGRTKASFKERINFHVIRRYFLSWFVFILVLLPFYQRFLYLVKEGGKTMWLQKPIYQDLKNCTYELFNNKEVYQYYVYACITIGVLILFRRLRNKDFKIKLLLFGIVSGPGMLYLNYVIASYSPIFLSRYVLFTFLGFIIAISYLFSAIRLRFGIKIVLALCMYGFAYTRMVIPREVKQNYKGAVNYLSSVQKEGVVISTDLPDVFSYYYDKKIFNIADDAKKSDALFRRGIVAQNYDLNWPDRLDVNHVSDVYYTQSFEYLNDGDKRVQSKLGSMFTFVESIDQFKEVFILHYRNDNYRK